MRRSLSLFFTKQLRPENPQEKPEDESTCRPKKLIPQYKYSMTTSDLKVLTFFGAKSIAR